MFKPKMRWMFPDKDHVSFKVSDYAEHLDTEASDEYHATHWLFRPILPHSKFCKHWDRWMLLCVMWTMIVLPLTVGFNVSCSPA